MSSVAIRENAIELAWSLWSELGVPGVFRHHAHTIIDPEPLIVATPILAADDPRLMEHVFGWCASHSDRVSASRLRGLLGGVRGKEASRFSSFAAALLARGVKWPIIDRTVPPWSEPSRLPSPPLLPLERPSMLRFRLRALSGVGARADVLCELLSSPEVWQSAADLARQGYTKRNVARVLSGLESAGIATRRRDGNTSRYRLSRPVPLREIAAGNDLPAPAWPPLLRLVLDLLGLLDHEANSAGVRRVEANRLREHLLMPCQSLDLEPPPPTRGIPEAWDVLLTWSVCQMGDIAAGTSPVFSTGGLRQARKA